MMEAQQAQAAQQSQTQSAGWGSGSQPVPSSSTPNNSALPNPWGAIPAPQQSPFGKTKIENMHILKIGFLYCIVGYHIISETERMFLTTKPLFSYAT